MLVVGAAAAYLLVQSRLADSPEPHQALVGRYCVDCHNAAERAGDLSLERADLAHVEQDPELWEAVVRKLRVAMMPPPDAPQPGGDRSGRRSFPGSSAGWTGRRARTPTRGLR